MPTQVTTIICPRNELSRPPTLTLTTPIPCACSTHSYCDAALKIQGTITSCVISHLLNKGQIRAISNRKSKPYCGSQFGNLPGIDYSNMFRHEYELDDMLVITWAWLRVSNDGQNAHSYPLRTFGEVLVGVAWERSGNAGAISSFKLSKEAEWRTWGLDTNSCHGRLSDCDAPLGRIQAAKTR